jgi:hypothetical protein
MVPVCTVKSSAPGDAIKMAALRSISMRTVAALAIPTPYQLGMSSARTNVGLMIGGRRNGHGGHHAWCDEHPAANRRRRS